ncbi:MAG: VanZ family protein [Bacilli bacterium]|jgi:glycopeptide antibiotics resistance protein
MIKEVLINTLYNIWPMVFIFSVIISSVRIAFILSKKIKFVLYKEVLGLIFIIYVLILFHIVTFQDVNYGDLNYIPFAEMFRHPIGSALFVKNFIGNLLLFVPFGIFLSIYLKPKRIYVIFFIASISSLAIEYTQLRIGRTFDVDDILLNVTGAIIGYLIYIGLSAISKRFPKIIRSEGFLNLLVLIMIILIGIYFIS